MAEQTPNQTPPQFSPDGRWWWDGQCWIPVAPPSPSAPGAAPIKQESQITGPAVVPGPRRAPIQLGGAADRRFERRLAVVRRVARYLLLADVLRWVFVFTFDSYSQHAAGGPMGPIDMALSYTLPILVVLSLVQVVNGRAGRETTVGADPERVFALLVDPYAWVRRGGTWLGRYRRIDAVETAASGGTKGRAALTALGLPGEMRWEMMEYQPPRSVVTFARTNWIGIPALHLASWSLEPTGAGVRVSLEQEWRRLGLALTNALSGRMLGQALDRTLARLKAEAERLPSP